MNYLKPAWTVTVGNSYWNKVQSRTNSTINYEPTTTDIPSIKTLGLARTNSETKVFASGAMYDYVNQTAKAEIALGAVALPSDMEDVLDGAEQTKGFTFNRTSDLKKELAFGYWAQLSNGEYLYYWHPICKLVIENEDKETKSETIPEPNRPYRLVILPFNGLWRVKYSTEKARAMGFVPLTIEEFFAQPVYSEGTMPEQIALPQLTSGVGLMSSGGSVIVG